MEFEQELEFLRATMLGYVTRKLAGCNASQDDAEDIVQDAILTAWERKESFERLGEGALRAWLLRITEYKARDWLRAARVARENREEWLGKPIYREAVGDAADYAWESEGTKAVADCVDVEATALDNLEKDEERERLYTLIATCQTLSSCERQALLLRCAGDLSHVELGRVMGLSEGAARVLWHRATVKLKEAVGGVAR